jgi:hypothetical protein
MILTAYTLLFAYCRWGKLSTNDIRIIKTTTFKQLFVSPYIQTKSLEQYTVVLRTAAP